MRRNYKSRLIEFVPRQNEKFIIKAKQGANLDYFSKYEIEKMNELIEKYADPQKTEWEIADRICKDTHTEIKAYDIAYKKEHNSVINYDDTFDNILYKNESDLSGAEEKFLQYKY